MDLIIDIIKVEGKKLIYNKAEVPKNKYLLVKQALIHQKKLIVDILKDYKEKGLITSISQPRNWTMKEELKELVRAKRMIRDSIRKLTDFYK